MNFRGLGLRSSETLNPLNQLSLEQIFMFMCRDGEIMKHSTLDVISLGKGPNRGGGILVEMLINI
jgi:hypothetical protein